MSMKIQDIIIQTLLNNPSIKNEDVVKIVKKVHKDCKTSVYCISWYRSKLKNKDPRYLKYLPHRSQEEENQLDKMFGSNESII